MDGPHPTSQQGWAKLANGWLNCEVKSAEVATDEQCLHHNSPKQPELIRPVNVMDKQGRIRHLEQESGQRDPQCSARIAAPPSEIAPGESVPSANQAHHRHIDPHRGVQRKWFMGPSAGDQHGAQCTTIGCQLNANRQVRLIFKPSSPSRSIVMRDEWRPLGRDGLEPALIYRRRGQRLRPLIGRVPHSTANRTWHRLKADEPSLRIERNHSHARPARRRILSRYRT